MKKNEFFGHISDEEVTRIADEYPTGDKKQRDRIFKKIERRVEGTPAYGDEVSGVELYRPRILTKVVSAAAAFVLVAGAATGGGYLLLRDRGMGAPGADISDTSDATEAVTEDETTAEATEVQLTADDIIAKIMNRDYDAYDQISMKYHTTVNSGNSCEHSEARRDKITGNESLVKIWTHTPEYYKDLDEKTIEEYGGLDKLAETITQNEMFMYKDTYVCVYSDTSADGPDQYEAFDRSRCEFDNPNVFCNLYSEYLINECLYGFEVQDMITDVDFIGRDCTQLVMEAKAGDEAKAIPPEQTEPPITITEPAPANAASAVLTKTLTLTVDNETGFILAAKLEYGKNYEEFSVEEILFNDEAALPEDGAYIKGRISGCIPNCEETAAYDLSQLDE